MNEQEKQFINDSKDDLEEKYEVKKEKKLNIFFITLCVILTIIAGIIFLFTFKDLSKEQSLYKSLNSIEKNDTIDMKIYSSGDYGKIEKIIKESYKVFKENNDNLNNSYKELSQNKILNANIYKTEGPTFDITKKRIDENTAKRNEYIANIKNLYSASTIQKNIKENNFNSYYGNLYRKILNELNYSNHIKAIEKYEIEINEHISSITKILDYLSANKDKWEVSENELESYEPNFILEFNDMIKKLNTNIK